MTSGDVWSTLRSLRIHRRFTAQGERQVPEEFLLHRNIQIALVIVNGCQQPVRSVEHKRQQLHEEKNYFRYTGKLLCEQMREYGEF